MMVIEVFHLDFGIENSVDGGLGVHYFLGNNIGWFRILNFAWRFE